MMADEIRKYSPNRKAVRIEFEYDDGTILSAEGDHAEEVMKYLDRAQVMYVIHGASYTGRMMIERRRTPAAGGN